MTDTDLENDVDERPALASARVGDGGAGSTPRDLPGGGRFT